MWADEVFILCLFLFLLLLDKDDVALIVSICLFLHRCYRMLGYDCFRVWVDYYYHQYSYIQIYKAAVGRVLVGRRC